MCGCICDVMWNTLVFQMVEGRGGIGDDMLTERGVRRQQREAERMRRV